MDGSQTPQKGGAAPRKPGGQLRIAAKLRRAIDFIAIDGCSAREAARRAGMHEVSIYKALAKPHVAQALEDRKAEVILECEKLKGIARAIAIQEGITLMRTSPSHAVRARMVEFFAGEAKQTTVAVQINNAPAAGYIYARPDTKSEGGLGQPIEGKAKDVTPE